MADITGSRAYERFTGPQIKHIYKTQRQVYNSTERIALISSFLPTLLVGEYAPIDVSDGSGMNLLDIYSHKWNQTLLNIVAPNLGEKLGQPVLSNSLVGRISSYWCSRYGFSPACEIYAFSGDNPCSLVGLGLNCPGDIGLSLGTSDVLFAVTSEPKPSETEGSILVHPENFESYMMMLVYKNGATTRQRVRDSVSSTGTHESEWSNFSKFIQQTPPGNNGHLGFYFVESEITPNALNSGIVKFNDKDEMTSSEINEADCRGIIESQVLSYKQHAQLLGLNEISSIVVTGGGSVNREVLQIVADVFEMDVSSSTVANTAASGAAIRALNAFNKLHGHVSRVEQSELDQSRIVKPNADNFKVYRELFARFGKLEALAVEFLNNKK